MRLPRQRPFDLPLAESAPGRMLPWLTGALVYVVVLMLAIAVAADQTVRSFDHRERLITVTLPLVDPADGERDLRAALDVLLEEPFVLAAEPVNDAELRGLMAPWLGDSRAADLLLPRMIDVTLDPLADPDLAALQGTLSEAVPGAALALDPTGPADAERIAALLRNAGAGLALLALLAALLAIAATITLSLRLSGDSLALLRWMGASPHYLAAQYERHALAGGLRGGIAGFALATASVGGLIYASRSLAVAESVGLSLRPLDWSLLAATAVSLVLLVVGLVRAAAYRQLR